MSEYDVGKFPHTHMISENSLHAVFIENLRGVGSPSNAGKPLRSYFLSLHLLFVALLFLTLLTPSFSLSLPVIPGCGLQGYRALLQNKQGCVGSCCVFFFLGYLSYLCLHSGVTLFHSPTQGITSVKGIVVDLVGGCPETLQSSTV